MKTNDFGVRILKPANDNNMTLEELVVKLFDECKYDFFDLVHPGYISDDSFWVVEKDVDKSD